jgi:carbon monoxide dehydrogenase subunit G
VASIDQGLTMPTTEQSVTIARPMQDVWDFLIVPENWPTWEGSIIEGEKVADGPTDVGTQWRGETRVLGKKFGWVSEFTEVEAPTQFKAKSVDSKIGFEVATKLEAAGAGTRLTYRVDSETGLGGVFGKLADPFVERAYARSMRASLDTLADLLGGGA